MTLWDRWGKYAEVGQIIVCPEMELMAGDHQPPIVVGSGQLVVTSATTYTYELTGVPADYGHALRSLNRLRADPYDGRLRSRLRVIDTAGVEINAGWTTPSVVPADAGVPWRFTGECDSLWIVDDAPAPAGSEDVFLLPRRHRSRIVLRRFFDEAAGSAFRQRRVVVGGEELIFTLDDDNDRLTILAPASARLPLTFTENWLAEPLRIMFGQLAYPRMVGRRQDHRTMVSFRPSRRWDATSDACALWQGSGELIDRDGFWRTYAALLSYIADARGESGDANFEPNKLTRLYEEVIQATHSSRWIWALAHASAIEGLVQMMVPRGTLKADADAAEVANFCKFIDTWPGTNKQLENVAKSAANRTLYFTPVQFLRDMRSAGEITPDEFVAWDKLRNQVAHGSLVSPYSSAEEDKLLLDLSHLMHSVTRKLVAVP